MNDWQGVQASGARIPSLEARIVELEDDRANAEMATDIQRDRAWAAEARLAAVIALCDAEVPPYHTAFVADVRAAATGDPT